MIKMLEKTSATVIATIILIIAILLAFYVYQNSNVNRILRQSASYIESSTIQTADRMEDVLISARYSISNIARLYGKTLSDNEVKVEDLADLADRTVFDYVDFINADGIDTNSEGASADVSDRSYFTEGMQGKSGMDGTYVSKTTGERMVIFYAPVRYQDEIVGVLTGHYRDARVKQMLETSLFGEKAPSFLCLADGTIVSEVDIGKEGEAVIGNNILDYLNGRVSQKDREGIMETLNEEGSYAFSYETDEGETIGFLTSLSKDDWTIIQLFPIRALTRMQNNANAAGLLLEAALSVLFVVFMLFLLLREKYQKKRLSEEKQEAEGIIKGINQLFTYFILVDLEENTYQYMNGQMPDLKGMRSEGNYSDFPSFWKNRIITSYDQAPVEQGLTDEIFMEQVLRKDYIQEYYPESVPFGRYEYQIQNGQEDKWENMSVIVLERKEGIPVSVLFAIQEITSLKMKERRTQDALKEAYQAAEAANRAKSEFLSRMSHDIRTPMNAIMGMTAIAAMNLKDQSRVEDCLGKITISSQHLLGIINEVLDMSKIESGKLELMDEEFALSETVDGLISIFQPQIEGRKQTLSITLTDVVHEKVIGDSQRLSQVFVNIMGNAIKFTPEGGNISLHINEIPSRIPGNACYEFIFTDTGIGMDEEFLEKVFEPFARANDSVTGKIEGTGLGMSISRSIVSMMNGDIQIKSQKGNGTQVKVTVFLQYVTNTEEEFRISDGSRIMVVDDEQIACENACHILSSIHMSSVWFTDGDKAIEELVRDYQEDGTYAAVILDWKMPQKDGLQVTREIRQKIGEDIPIIILSAYDWSEIEQEALKAGVNEFIAKPLFKSRLVYVMKKVLLGQREEEIGQEVALGQEEEFVGKRLLLVDDNELNLEIANDILTLAGFEVEEARDGKEAVDCLISASPGTYQLVLMDIQMPIMNGYEATKAIRQSGRGDLEVLPIFAMTADAFSDDIRKAADAGMNGHIAKPIDTKKLMDTLKSAMV